MADRRWRIERLDVVESTQALLRARLESDGDLHRLVLRAAVQTKGRGRREHGWASPRGGSYQSLALRDETGELRAAHVPLSVAVGVAEELSQRVPQIALKWPNDLHLRDRAAARSEGGPRLTGKVGGILCQYLRGHLLVGVGINVRNEVPFGAGQLDGLEPEEVSRMVLDGVDRALSLPPSRLPERYAPFDLLAGRVLRVHDRGEELIGRASGVGVNGCLLLESGEGAREICSGRIVEFDAAA